MVTVELEVLTIGHHHKFCGVFRYLLITSFEINEIKDLLFTIFYDCIHFPTTQTGSVRPSRHSAHSRTNHNSIKLGGKQAEEL